MTDKSLEKGHELSNSIRLIRYAISEANSEQFYRVDRNCNSTDESIGIISEARNIARKASLAYLMKNLNRLKKEFETL